MNTSSAAASTSYRHERRTGVRPSLRPPPTGRPTLTLVRDREPRAVLDDPAWYSVSREDCWVASSGDSCLVSRPCPRCLNVRSRALDKAGRDFPSRAAQVQLAVTENA